MTKIEGFETFYKGKKNGIPYVIGTVGELITAKVLTYCDYSQETFCFIPSSGKAYFAKTFDEIVTLKNNELSK